MNSNVGDAGRKCSPAGCVKYLRSHPFYIGGGYKKYAFFCEPHPNNMGQPAF